eukprot:PLAT12285.2.p2 GENE.PLAT12285.2~~PLAT12285.2.p2  ORF type:complete len:223 (-),score=108.88 PLAT12285.2:76-744(-)
MLRSSVSRLTSRLLPVRALSASPVALPDLPYDYAELEPVISGEIMELHHGKHHAAYVTNYNLALEQLAEAYEGDDHAKAIALQAALQFNGGGHINHSIFWQNLAPPSKGGGGEPEGELAVAIAEKWGSFEDFKTLFNAKTAAVQGSGWGWLGWDNENGGLAITAMPNQTPLAVTGHTPLLGIDVWEHAYYLQYKNARPEYLKEVWNVINWADVSARYAAAKK